MERIAVYCGSNKGHRPEYAKAAEQLGTLLAREKIDSSMAAAWWA
jgi:predicted Rossmann-fold nucleotide-binding protein